MGKATVYIVDDNDIVRDSIAGLLSIKLGVDIQSFASGHEFLQSSYRIDCACLILDFRMPGFSGKDVLDQLVKNGDSIPTILISGQIDGIPNYQNRPKFVVSFLEKPYATDALISAIKPHVE